MLGKSLDEGRILRIRFDDLSTSMVQTRIGANSKPDFDYTNLGLLFPQNDPSEKIYTILQMSHKKKLGTPVRFHVHYIQKSNLKPVFAIDTKFYSNGTNVPEVWTTLTTADATPNANTGVFPYVFGNLLQIGKFEHLNAPLNETVSANIDLIFYRTDNIVTGDILVKYIDLHFAIDADGSLTEYGK